MHNVAKAIRVAIEAEGRQSLFLSPLIEAVGKARMLGCVFVFVSAVSVSAADGDLPASVGTPLTAANDAQLTTALQNSQPGQHIVLTGTGPYVTDRILGSGKVVIGDDLSNMPEIRGLYTLNGPDALVYGLDFNGSGGSKGRILLYGDRLQVLRCRIHHTTQIPIELYNGKDVVISRNEIYSWGSTADCGACKGIMARGPYMNLTDGAVRPRITYNYLHDQINYNPETCTQDAEVISIGHTAGGGRASSKMEAYVGYNFIVNCGGDGEGLDAKGCSYSVIAFNHCIGVRGMNNRWGGYNDWIGNRVENVIGAGHPGNFSRGGKNNRSIGEVIDAGISLMPGSHDWDSGPSVSPSTLRPEGVHIAGTSAKYIDIGVDYWNKGDLAVENTLIEQTNLAPNLGPEQTGTINRWNQAASVTIPEAIRLTAADVGPLSTFVDTGGTVDTTGSDDCLSSSLLWSNRSMPAQTGLFTVTFTATPDGPSVSTVTALSSGAGANFADYAVLVHFDSSGQINARNGGAYEADADVPYVANTAYFFRVAVDIAAGNYSVYVTPDSGSEILLAGDYVFRTEQSAVKSLDNWGVRAGIGSHTVCDFQLEPPTEITSPMTDPVWPVAVSVNVYDLQGRWIGNFMRGAWGMERLRKVPGIGNGVYLLKAADAGANTDKAILLMK